jgi:hypothetical protein
MTNECGTTVTMPIQLTVEECMGIDDEALAENAVMLYPNPVSGILNLELKNENFEVQEISIVNMLGQTVYKGNDETLRIDVGFLNSGMYQVTVNTDKGAWIGKFIKE